MNKQEFLLVYYSDTYNTRVEYFGNNSDILGMFRTLDIWKSTGEFKSSRRWHDDPENKYVIGSYSFELSKEIYLYLKTEDFKQAMGRKRIEMQIM